MRAPHGRSEQQRADRLVKRGEPDRDARQHGEDAEQNLGAERRVDGDRRRSRARNLADLAGEDDHRRDHHPRPPAVDEVDEVGIVGQRPEEAATPVDAVARLNAETVKALNMPEVREVLRAQTVVPTPTTPEEFAALIKSDE